MRTNQVIPIQGDKDRGFLKNYRFNEPKLMYYNKTVKALNIDGTYLLAKDLEFTVHPTIANYIAHDQVMDYYGKTSHGLVYPAAYEVYEQGVQFRQPLPGQIPAHKAYEYLVKIPRESVIAECKGEWHKLAYKVICSPKAALNNTYWEVFDGGIGLRRTPVKVKLKNNVLIRINQDAQWNKLARFELFKRIGLDHKAMPKKKAKFITRVEPPIGNSSPKRYRYSYQLEIPEGTVGISREPVGHYQTYALEILDSPNELLKGLYLEYSTPMSVEVVG